MGLAFFFTGFFCCYSRLGVGAGFDRINNNAEQFSKIAFPFPPLTKSPSVEFHE